MPPEQQTSRTFRVRGVVQGVGFRWWTRRRAEELGLRGTVRNCADGSVEIRAAGTAPQLERLRRLLEQGPSGAVIREVAEEPGPADSGLPARFEITL